MASTTLDVIRGAKGAISAAAAAITHDYLQGWSALTDHELPPPLLSVLGHLGTLATALDDLHHAIEQGGAMAATSEVLTELYAERLMNQLG
jgi:hypothetical protein